jgi:regulator of nucleoside diphosphate kinase
MTTILGRAPPDGAYKLEIPTMTIDNMTTQGSGRRPTIILSVEDYERLSLLANAARKRLPDLAGELADEVGRARVLSREKLPPHLVCMNSEVEFLDDVTGKIQKVILVYPDDADISERKVSVLTPIGTALIGLRAGNSITWKTPSGEVRQLTVVSVRDSEAG